MREDKRKIIISGASGFTGQNLLNFMNNNFEIYIVDKTRKSIRKASSDVRKEVNLNSLDKLEELILPGELHAILHLATVYSREESPRQEDAIWEANFFLGQKLLNLAKSWQAHFCHIESYLQFEDSMESQYVKSKAAFSELVEQERIRRRTSISSLVFFDNYGIGDTRKKVVDELITEKMAGNRVLLSHPDKVMILTSIVDVSKALLQALDSKLEGRFRVNSDDKFTLHQISEFINSFPKGERPSTLEDYCYIAEDFELLRCFKKTVNFFDYLENRLNSVSKK